MSRELRQKVTLDSLEAVGHAQRLLQAVPPDATKEMIIQEHVESRHLTQNGLYWRWLDELVGQTGYTTDDMHDKFKVTYLLPIYLKDPVTDEQKEWVGLYDMIHEDGTPAMRERMVKTISTRMADVHQFKEFMDKVEAFCQSRGFKLPTGGRL